MEFCLFFFGIKIIPAHTFRLQMLCCALEIIICLICSNRNKNRKSSYMIEIRHTGRHSYHIRSSFTLKKFTIQFDKCITYNYFHCFTFYLATTQVYVKHIKIDENIREKLIHWRLTVNALSLLLTTIDHHHSFNVIK